MNDQPLTIREAYLQASSFLHNNGVQDHRFTAELLLRYVLGWDRTQFFTQWEQGFPQESRTAWELLLHRRALGEPLQYILGEQEFYGIAFQVTPSVLIPRPETEILVENIIKRGTALWASDEQPIFADIGTGSGVISISIAIHCPKWRILSSDISPSAIEIAQSNAARCGVGDRISFFEGDLLEPFLIRKQRVDILVSNPPYIPTGEMARLQREIRLHEPQSALDGGEDGLLLYRRMVGQLPLLPQLPRLIGFEVGLGQANEVAGMLASVGHWDVIDIIPDLAGIDRHVVGISNRS